MNEDQTSVDQLRERHPYVSAIREGIHLLVVLVALSIIGYVGHQIVDSFSNLGVA